MSVSFAVVALAGLTANGCSKKLTCPDCLICCSQVYCLDTLSEHFSSAEYELSFSYQLHMGGQS